MRFTNDTSGSQCREKLCKQWDFPMCSGCQPGHPWRLSKAYLHFTEAEQRKSSITPTKFEAAVYTSISWLVSLRILEIESFFFFKSHNLQLKIGRRTNVVFSRVKGKLTVESIWGVETFITFVLFSPQTGNIEFIFAPQKMRKSRQNRLQHTL